MLWRHFLSVLGTLCGIVAFGASLDAAEPAADELQQWRVDLAAMEPDAAGLFLSWLGKLPGGAVRIALVLEHLWWVGERPNEAAPTEISEAATLAATATSGRKKALPTAFWPPNPTLTLGISDG